MKCLSLVHFSLIVHYLKYNIKEICMYKKKEFFTQRLKYNDVVKQIIITIKYLS